MSNELGSWVNADSHIGRVYGQKKREPGQHGVTLNDRPARLLAYKTEIKAPVASAATSLP